MSATCCSSQVGNLSLLWISIHPLLQADRATNVSKWQMNIEIPALIELFIFYQTAYEEEIHSEIYIRRLLARQYRQEIPAWEIKEILCLYIMEQYVIVWLYAIFSKLSFTAQMDPQLCSVLSSTQHRVIISYRVVSILFSPHFMAPNLSPQLFSNPALKIGWLILS